jgi:hypothetical protein
MSGTSQTFHAAPSSAPTGRGRIKPVTGVRGLVPQCARRDVVQGLDLDVYRRVIVDFLGPTAGKNSPSRSSKTSACTEGDIRVLDLSAKQTFPMKGTNHP